MQDNDDEAAIYDASGKALCPICIDGILPAPYESADLPGRRGWRPAGVTYWSDEVYDAFQAYLRDPQCTSENHAWWEGRARREAEGKVFDLTQDLLQAKLEAKEIAARAPGWSCGD